MSIPPVGTAGATSTPSVLGESAGGAPMPVASDESVSAIKHVVRSSLELTSLKYSSWTLQRRLLTLEKELPKAEESRQQEPQKYRRLQRQIQKTTQKFHQRLHQLLYQLVGSDLFEHIYDQLGQQNDRIGWVLKQHPNNFWIIFPINQQIVLMKREMARSIAKRIINFMIVQVTELIRQRPFSRPPRILHPEGAFPFSINGSAPLFLLSYSSSDQNHLGS